MTTEQLAEIRNRLEAIVCTDGCDRGVVLLSQDGPTHTEIVNGRPAQVYDHVNFSPLGDALIELYDFVVSAAAPAAPPVSAGETGERQFCAVQRCGVPMLLDEETGKEVARVWLPFDEVERIAAILNAASQSAKWECAVAKLGKTDPPQDCDYPHCGCDPNAAKVVAALIEQGWEPRPNVDEMCNRIGIAMSARNPEGRREIRDKIESAWKNAPVCASSAPPPAASS
jgi:hypothetical protein